MNKKILLTLFLALIVICSVTAVSASEVNITDSYTTSLVDDTQDVSVPMENTADSSENSVLSDSNVDNDPSKVSLSSQEVLESDDSNTLSTNLDSNSNVLSSSNGSAVVSASSEKSGSVVSSIAKSKTVQSKDVTKYYKGSTKYTATFLDINGKALANTKVKITVNGVTYTPKTNANGVASLGINLKPGTYKVVSENPSTGYKLTTSFKVLSTVSASDISKVREDARRFYATFLNSNGKALANKNIKFKVNGKTYTQTTNSKGVASLTLFNLKPGTYKIISYNTDGLSKTNTIKVYKKVSSKLISSTYTFYKSDSKTIKVTLHNRFGYAPGAGKTIKFTINGKSYYRDTNSKGAAYLRLPSLNNGVYTVTYKYAGNDYYYSSSATNYVAVISTKTTSFKVKSATTFYKGSNTFKVAVYAGSVPLPKKTITFTVNGKSYTKTTDKNGIASLPINLNVGKHTISYSIKKDSKINAKSASSAVTIKQKDTSIHNGYWLFGADMKSVNLNDLKSKGVTDIFLNYYAYEKFGKSGVETWVASAKNAGIKVHIWVQVFYNGKWVNPVSGGKENSAYFKTKINEIKTYANTKGVAGIHLDYLRYPGTAYKTSGGTAAINSFVKQAVSAVKAINSNIIVSAALMPETTSNAYYYGQDMATLSKYLDVVVPMVYKGNYKASSSWITTTTKWFVDNSKGAKVWSGIQTYVSDDDTTKLSLTALTNDIKAAFNGKAAGVVLFRYGISNNVNFNSVSTSTTSTSSSTAKSVSVKNIIDAATNVKKDFQSKGKFPSSVTVGGQKCTLPEFLYLMSQAIYQLGNSNTKAISIISGVKAPASPSGDTISSQDLYKAKYLVVAKNVANYIKTHKQAPNYASSAVGKIIYSELLDSFSRVLAFYGASNEMPNYVTIKSSNVATASGPGLNEKNTIKDLTIYLKSSTHCQVDNSVIKKLVTQVTKGLSSQKDKATAIYNYVRDKVSYSFYYDTKYGAVGTANAKTGNCVDQSHLLVAMYRTADLPARYVHGTCTFSSGSTYGHVWTQVLVNGKWVVSDPTSSRNSFGTIANWNTKTFTLHGIYSGISF